MAFTAPGAFTFNHADQADRPSATAAERKTSFDSRAKLVRDYLIDTLLVELARVTDSQSGADNIGMTAITETGANATVQSIIEALITRLKAVTDSASGADLIGMTAITETGAAATVQAVVEALITRLKATTDSASGADLIGATAISGWAGATVQAILEAAKTDVDAKATASILSTHTATKASDSVLGHVKVDNSTITIDGDGVIAASDLDNGRYQSDFGFGGATLSGCALDGSSVSLDIPVNSSQLTHEVGSDSAFYGNYGEGQRFDATFTATMDEIVSISFYLTKTGSPGDIRLTVYDETSSSLLATITKTSAQINTETFNTFTFAPLAVTRGHILQVRLDQNGSGNGTNCYAIGRATTDAIANSYRIYSGNLWSTKVDSTGEDVSFTLIYNTLTTSGTATKTITPSDLKAWGNAKWTQTTPSNTDVVLDILDASNNVLKSDVTSIADLSDISVGSYTSIKTRWTLTRNAVTDTSPTVSSPSVTWEGAGLGQVARVKNTASLSVPNDNDTVVPFDTKIYDTDNMVDLTAYSTRITVHTAGYYAPSVSARFSANATGYRSAFFKVNNTTAIGRVMIPAEATGAQTMLCFSAPPYYFAVGDYVEVFVRQTSGGALDLQAVAEYSPILGMARVG